MPSHSGRVVTVLRSGGGALSTASCALATALSGPVTESNGLRERMASALVACGLAAGAAGTRPLGERQRGELAGVGAQARAHEVHDPLRVEERRDGHEGRG